MSEASASSAESVVPREEPANYPAGASAPDLRAADAPLDAGAERAAGSHLPSASEPRGTSPADAHDVAVTTGSPASSADEQACFGWKRGDQFVFGALLIAALVLMMVNWLRMSGWGIHPVEVERMKAQSYDYRLDINRATWVEWTQLEGIGDSLAQRIVADREQNGPFRSVDDLRRVSGIGPKTLARLRPWLDVSSGDEAGSPPVADRAP